MLCKRWISCFIGFPVKLALKAEDAHHLGPLGLAAFLLSFAVGATILGSQVSPRLPNFGYQYTDQTISMTSSAYQQSQQQS